MTVVPAASPAALPSPDVYESEYSYFPWGALLTDLIEAVSSAAPVGALVVDYMCGTGYVLGALSRRRPDLQCYGVSITEGYIEYGTSRYPDVTLARMDAFEWIPPGPVGVAICTAGLHHLPFGRQASFLRKLRGEMAPGSVLFLAEEVVRTHTGETGRRLGALELGSRLLAHCISAGAPDGVLAAALQILSNDVLLAGEFKVSEPVLVELLQDGFRVESRQHYWPEDDDAFGDVLLICSLN